MLFVITDFSLQLRHEPTYQKRTLVFKIFVKASTKELFFDFKKLRKGKQADQKDRHSRRWS